MAKENTPTSPPPTDTSGIAPAESGVLLRSSLWHAGYQQGMMDTLRAAVRDPAGFLAKAKPIAEAAELRQRQLAMAAALRGRAVDPAVKAARTQQLKRMQRDEEQAGVFAGLIRAGESTESARAKMGIGAVRAKRLRAIAVKLKWIRPRQRKAGAIP